MAALWQNEVQNLNSYLSLEQYRWEIGYVASLALKSARVWAPVIESGREFQIGAVREAKLNLEGSPYPIFIDLISRWLMVATDSANTINS